MMTTYYLDTSALSKRYVQEIGTAWVRALVAPAAGHTLLTARITLVIFLLRWAGARHVTTSTPAHCPLASPA